jgi:hypothetical protein
MKEAMRAAVLVRDELRRELALHGIELVTADLGTLSGSHVWVISFADRAGFVRRLDIEARSLPRSESTSAALTQLIIQNARES